MLAVISFYIGFLISPLLGEITTKDQCIRDAFLCKEFQKISLDHCMKSSEKDICLFNIALESFSENSSVFEKALNETANFNFLYILNRFTTRPHFHRFMLRGYTQPLEYSPIDKCKNKNDISYLRCVEIEAIKSSDLKKVKKICSSLKSEFFFSECLYISFVGLINESNLDVKKADAFCDNMSEPHWKAECFYSIADYIAKYTPSNISQITRYCSKSLKEVNYECVDHVTYLMDEDNAAKVCEANWKNLTSRRSVSATELHTAVTCPTSNLRDLVTKQNIDETIGIVQKACLEDMPDYFMKKNSFDKSEIIRIWKKNCFKILTRRIYHIYELNFKDMENICSKFSDPDGLRRCIEEFMRASLLSSQNKENSFDKCEKLSDLYKDHCFIGTYKAILTFPLKSDPFYKKLCKNLPLKLQDSCEEEKNERLKKEL